MSDIPKDGGPAFPIPDIYVPDEHRGCVSGSVGMTLRDYFAAAALSAMFIDRARMNELRDGRGSGMVETETAYILADAMLKAREGGQ